jgi:D-tyrosyl-tRNA(Tyr) deacylase
VAGLRGLIQRVKSASVVVNAREVGKIDQGILLLLGIEKGDDKASVTRLLNKVLKYRIFSDDNQKMNLSLTDIAGGLLVVSQFTLAAETKKGLRPGFSNAAEPSVALELYQQFLNDAKLLHQHVEAGIFSADMQVSLVNDGPVTFLLEV